MSSCKYVSKAVVTLEKTSHCISRLATQAQEQNEYIGVVEKLALITNNTPLVQSTEFIRPIPTT